MNVEQRLKELGLTLPHPPGAAGNYQPWILAGKLLHLSGQFPIENGVPRYAGRVGVELSEADGYAAARQAALNALEQIHAALEGFDRLDHLGRADVIARR